MSMCYNFKAKMDKIYTLLMVSSKTIPIGPHINCIDLYSPHNKVLSWE